MTNTLVPLLHREWLQHRLGWLLLAGIPLGFTVLMLASGIGSIDFDPETIAKAGTAFPIFVAMATMVGTALVVFGIQWLSSMFITSGLARRDHADRSVEFWLSVPVSHARSLGVPLLVHTVLAPAAALLVGILGGYVISALAVSRLVGVHELAALPWVQLIVASLAFTLRLLGGLVLATLWLSPLIMLTVLMGAWFRRWGWVIMVVGLGVSSILLENLFGQPLLANLFRDIFQHAGHAFINSMGPNEMSIRSSGDVVSVLRDVPSWALGDFFASLRDLASPLLLGLLAFSAGCFYLLVQWRQRGASATD